MYEFSEFVEKLNTLDTLNVQNCVNSMENWVHLLYRTSWFEEKFKFVECTISWKFYGELFILDVRKVRIHEKVRISWIFDNEKIQWKTLYIKRTEVLNLSKNLNSLTVRYRDNSMEILYITCTESFNLRKNSNSLNVRNPENSMEIYVH